MNSKIYYGEYSLSEWINMLLKNDIEIPPYQRYFVWDRESVIDLIKAFKDGRYVPPITICKSIGSDKKEHNYIVDGQQRLSAIFMYKYEFYYNSKIKKDDDLIEEHVEKNYKEWTINSIINNNINKNINKIVIDEIDKKNSPYECLLSPSEEYLKVNKDEILEKIFLGFSYIILENTMGINEQQKFYAQIFNDINTKGVSLTPVESRKAYYFISEKYVNLFNLNFENIDFVRYLAILSEYHKSSYKNDKSLMVARNTNSGRKMENYIIEYIISMSENEFKKFTKIEEIFGDEQYDTSKGIQYLEECLKEKYYKFDDKISIIYKDVKLFGLIYNVLFLHKKLKNKSQLEQDLDLYINKIIKNEKIVKSPNSNKNLNDRLVKSIEIYNKYLKE